ncbi:MAG: ParA family protein [Gemmatimonadaceae bacterium]|nr:ParA family protein [Gemmatimonadaceae bacterium]
MTFDDILPTLRGIFTEHGDHLAALGVILVNRDLFGRVRLIVKEQSKMNAEVRRALDAVTTAIEHRLGPYAYPAKEAVLYESDIGPFLELNRTFELLPNVRIVERLATDADWSWIEDERATAPPRIVYYSIKGGVGRSTALAVTAWSLAQRGERVMVVDLDLESPGLSSSLIPSDRRPRFGVTDWLVEDLVGNGDAVVEEMTSLSELSHDGEIQVVPAHGGDPGEYIAKLGRAWMPTVDEKGVRRPWSQRLNHLIGKLEQQRQPTVVLLDARAGIDEAASACLTDLGANAILSFAVDSDQTWSGYEILFRHWLRTGAYARIRERLQVVAALVPEVDTERYLMHMRERSWDLFTSTLYDQVSEQSVAMPSSSAWTFDAGDDTAPHFPWRVRWNRGFAALQSLYGRLSDIDEQLAYALFGPLIEGVAAVVIEHRQAT